MDDSEPTNQDLADIDAVIYNLRTIAARCAHLANGCTDRLKVQEIEVLSQALLSNSNALEILTAIHPAEKS